MKKILRFLLGWFSLRIIKKYKPVVVAVTGSVGKTTTKEVIADYLEASFRVGRSFANFNTEFGAPLAVLGMKKANWFLAIIKGFFLLVLPCKYYQVLVVEMGADKPGDIEYLVSIIPPTISVITKIGEYPSHLENYSSRQDLIKEKLKIKVGRLIFNIDDPDLQHLEGISYGFSDKADVRISDFHQKENGISFKVGQETFNLESYGRSWSYAVGAAVACAQELGAFQGEIKTNFQRIKIKKAINNSVIIDDSYNASPASVKMAIEVLNDLPAKRRIAILGDMKELGSNSQKIHQEILKYVQEKTDLVLVYGPEFNQLEKIDFQPQEGDLILIKGSRSMKMEKIVEKLCQ